MFFWRFLNFTTSASIFDSFLNFPSKSKSYVFLSLKVGSTFLRGYFTNVFFCLLSIGSTHRKLFKNTSTLSSSHTQTNIFCCKSIQIWAKIYYFDFTKNKRKWSWKIWIKINFVDFYALYIKISEQMFKNVPQFPHMDFIKHDKSRTQISF